jgi:hypothetical protein
MKTCDVFVRGYDCFKTPDGLNSAVIKSDEDTIKSDLERESIPLDGGFLWSQGSAISRISVEGLPERPSYMRRVTVQTMNGERPYGLDRLLEEKGFERVENPSE